MGAVGICLACYNGEKYILEQLESLLRQTYTNFACYIQDDGSLDDTVTVIRSFIAGRESLQDMRFKLVFVGKHQGVRDNFLSLMKCTSEPYVMFCDQDDVWLPEKIQISLDTVQRLEQKYGKECPLLTFTDLTVVDENLNVLKPTVYDGTYDPYERDWKRLIRTNNNFGNTEMMNRALVNLVNGINTELPKLAIHDNLVTSIAALTGKIEYIPKATILYRQHGKNAIGAKQYDAASSLKRILYLMKLIIKKDPRWGCQSVQEFAKVLNTLPLVPQEEKRVLEELVNLKNRNKLYRLHFYKKYGFYRGIRLLWA